MPTKKKDPKHILPKATGGQGAQSEIDWKVAIGLAECQCTQAQIAHSCRVAISTLIEAIKREHGLTWEQWYTAHASNGLSSIRQAQYAKAVETKDTTMLIWLGKNLLGQSDRKEVELSGKDGGPIETRALPATDNWIEELLGAGEKKTPPASRPN